VERVVERDHGGPSGRDARDLDRILDRFGAGVDQERLRRRLTGPRLVQQAANLDVGLVDPDHEALVKEAVDLFVDRRRGETVTGVLAAEAAGEVDVLTAVDVPDPRSLGARDHERRRRDAACDIPLALLPDALALAPGDDRRCWLILKRHRQRSFRSLRSPSLRRA
jgi:hypothetical protein